VRVFFAAGGSGFFGTGAPAPDFESPLITDLETGIGYGAFEHFHPPVSMYTTGQTFPFSHTPIAGLREHSRWLGKVLVCNVVFTGKERNEIQTTLLIEPMASTPGYR